MGKQKLKLGEALECGNCDCDCSCENSKLPSSRNGIDSSEFVGFEHAFVLLLLLTTSKLAILVVDSSLRFNRYSKVDGYFSSTNDYFVYLVCVAIFDEIISIFGALCFR